MALDPARAATRLAVRRSLGSPGGGPVLVACSGGADSLALLAAAVFEGRKASVPVIGVVVDHGLQDGSAEHTARVVAQMAELGADETASIRVRVDGGPSGIEAGAREARYAALGQLASHFGSSSVLLGHTLDDQAETVLLGLARGSGGRSLQGMRRFFDEDGVRFVRPLLELRREGTEAACRADGIEWWEDPHNTDPRFTRSRIRHAVLPLLERELGPGIAEALARTGSQIRADMDVLETVEEAAWAIAGSDEGVDLAAIADEPEAIRTRLVRRAAIQAGAIVSELTYEHVQALARINRGQDLQLPGHVTAYREGAVLRFRRT